MRTKHTPPPASPWVRTAEPLLWLTGAARETQTNPSYFFDSRLRTDRPHWVLQLTLSGQAFFERNKRRTLLTPGTAFLHQIPGDFRYGYPPEKTEPYEHVFVSMRGDAERWCNRIVDTHGHILRFPSPNPVAPLMLAIARQRAMPAVPDRYHLSAQLYQLLMTLISTLNASRLAVEPLVTRSLELIAARAPEHNFDVTSLAASLGCSREHLARQFRAATGVSPSDYILQHRLRIAANALRSSASKLEVIAHEAGFAGANYFCRAFRKRVGITPAEFRQRPTLAMP